MYKVLKMWRRRVLRPQAPTPPNGWSSQLAELANIAHEINAQAHLNQEIGQTQIGCFSLGPSLQHA